MGGGDTAQFGTHENELPDKDGNPGLLGDVCVCVCVRGSHTCGRGKCCPIPPPKNTSYQTCMDWEILGVLLELVR